MTTQERHVSPHTRGQYVKADFTLLGADHVRRYRESDGEEGYLWNGVTALLLTTTGRRSGQPRTSPLIFARDGEDFVVVASVGGGPKHPQWYLNLQDHPAAEVQVRAQRIPVLARTAGPEERGRLWDVCADAWPNYDQYQERTERLIPVVVLTPTGGGA